MFHSRLMARRRIEPTKQIYFLMFSILMFLANFAVKKYPLHFFGILDNKPKLFFGIVTMKKDFYKRERMRKIWTKRILQKGHDFAYVAEEPLEKNTKRIPLQTFADVKMTTNVNRFSKRMTGAKYFLENTTADFYVSITDDVYVDAENIDRMAYELAQKYDTVKDVAFLGDCMITPDKYTFYHGGSGYIFTRYSARQFVEYANELLNIPRGTPNCIPQLGKDHCTKYNPADDVEINRFMVHIGKNQSDGAVGYMVGNNFKELSSKTFDAEKLPACPEFYNAYCGYSIRPIESVYIVHPFRKFNESILMWNNFKKLLETPGKFGFYNTWMRNHLCIMKDA